MKFQIVRFSCPGRRKLPGALTPTVFDGFDGFLADDGIAIATESALGINVLQ
jgi:hypothetical protein